MAWALLFVCKVYQCLLYDKLSSTPIFISLFRYTSLPFKAFLLQLSKFSFALIYWPNRELAPANANAYANSFLYPITTQSYQGAWVLVPTLCAYAVVYRPAMAQRRFYGRKSRTRLLCKALAKPRKAGKSPAHLLFLKISNETRVHHPLPSTQASVST